MHRSGGADFNRPATVPNFLVPVASGFAAIAIAYGAASADLGAPGLAISICAAVLFAIVCYFANRSGTGDRPLEHGTAASDKTQDQFDGIQDRFVALDEANEVFGTSLNASDMFRLVTCRVGEIFPLDAAALIIPDRQRGTLRFVSADGVNSDLFRGLEIANSLGLAGRALLSGVIETDAELAADTVAIGRERLSGLSSTAAIPLVENDQVFAVYQIFRNGPIDRGQETLDLLRAIRDRVTPVFSRSLAFERSLSSALTDPLTGLPNERAFFMVLENQLAESHRHRDERPLTVLSIDVRDFGAVNSMLGHAVGDRMLEFVGKRIGEHLRKMDFLARMVNDEFSVILPTAAEKVAFEIIERIKAGCQHHEFEIAEGEGVAIALNIGWATFWKDGETSDQLLRTAHQRKRQAKSERPAGVLWFPKEYVN